MTINKIEGRILLRKKIYNMLKEAIVTGELDPGQRLIESQLAREMGISRTPIREALRQLESEGYITSIDNGGVKVSEITEDDIHEWYEIKKVLDKLSIIKTIDNITEDQIKDLEEYINKSKKLLEKNNYDKDKMIALHSAFHQKIFEASNNKLIKTIMEDYQHYNLRLRKYMADSLSWHDKMVKEHEKILQAIKEKDKDTAIELVNEHSISGKQQVLERISQSKKK